MTTGKNTNTITGFTEAFLSKLKEQSFVILLMLGVIYYQHRLMEERVAFWQAQYEKKDSDIDEISEKGFLHVWGFKKRIFNIEGEEQALFGNLISSRLNLKDHIIECVTKNRELYGTETNNLT